MKDKQNSFPSFEPEDHSFLSKILQNDFSELPDLPTDEELGLSTSPTFDLEATERAFRAVEENLRIYSEKHQIAPDLVNLDFEKQQEEAHRRAEVQIGELHEKAKEKRQESMLQHLAKNAEAKTQRQKDLEDEILLRNLLKEKEKPLFFEEKESLADFSTQVEEVVKKSEEPKSEKLTMPLNLDTVEASAKVPLEKKSQEENVQIEKKEEQLWARASQSVENSLASHWVEPVKPQRVTEPLSQKNDKKKKEKDFPPFTKLDQERDALAQALVLQNLQKKKLSENATEKALLEETLLEETKVVVEAPKHEIYEAKSLEETEVLLNRAPEMTEEQKEEVKNLFEAQKRKEDQRILDEVKRAKKRKLFAFIGAFVLLLSLVSGTIYTYWKYQGEEILLKSLQEKVHAFSSENLAEKTYAQFEVLLSELTQAETQSFFKKTDLLSLKQKLEAELLERQNAVMLLLEQEVVEQNKNLPLYLSQTDESKQQVSVLEEKIKKHFEEYKQLLDYTQNASQALESLLFSFQKNVYQAFQPLKAAQEERLKYYKEKGETEKIFAEKLLNDLSLFEMQGLESLLSALTLARSQGNVEEVKKIAVELKNKIDVFGEQSKAYFLNIEVESQAFEAQVLLNKAVQSKAEGKVERANRIFTILETLNLSDSFKEKEEFKKLKEELTMLNVLSKPETSEAPLHFQVKPLIFEVSQAKASKNYRYFSNHNLSYNAFLAFLQEMYDKGYVLVDGRDAFDPLGKVWNYQLPEGKKALLLDFQDEASLTGNDGNYFAQNLFVENDKLVAKTANGQSSEANLVLALEAFILSHPDFSFDGARANIQLQSKEMLFGQNVQSEGGQALLKYLVQKGYRFTAQASLLGATKEEVLSGLVNLSASFTVDENKTLQNALFEEALYAKLEEADFKLLENQGIKDFQIRKNTNAYEKASTYIKENLMDLRPYMLYRKEYSEYFDNTLIYQVLVKDNHFVAAS